MNRFEREKSVVGYQASIQTSTQTETGLENIEFDASIVSEVKRASTHKRKYCDKSIVYPQLAVLAPTIGVHTRESDCKRISETVGCGLRTVKDFHKKYLKEKALAASASSALVAVGSPAPTTPLRAGGGDGGPSAAPCWSAPPQVISTASWPILSLSLFLPLSLPLPPSLSLSEKLGDHPTPKQAQP
jgi:hypothetical protein